MGRPRIDSMTITYHCGSARRKPKAGDEKVVKGVTYVRQHSRVPQGMPHAGALIYSGSRPCFEWVEKGSDRDRTTRRALGGDA